MLKKFEITEKKRRVVTDMLINLIGTGLPLVALQLIVYPIVARTIDAESYGRMQSLLSFIFLISGTIGGALSTTRLIHQFDYDENNWSVRKADTDNRKIDASDASWILAFYSIKSTSSTDVKDHTIWNMVLADQHRGEKFEEYVNAE